MYVVLGDRKMDPDAFTSTLFKWDSRTILPTCSSSLMEGTGGLKELFHAYGVRYYTAAKVAELGFTARTLVDMKEEELEHMMNSLSQIFRWDLLVGERYGIKAAVRAERRRIQDHHQLRIDSLPQEGVQQHKEAVGSTWDVRKRMRSRSKTMSDEEEEEEEEEERQREHPFIVTEPGEVARGKKNGLDYLFHLYEQCRDFLIQVQNIAKESGQKCPTKVTNEVFRYAKKAGAHCINKPKMRHYVHCYALHCLDKDTSNQLRRQFKETGQKVGAWRQACYNPLVAIAALHHHDIDAIFNSHPRLSIWYVPTKLRQLCHAHRNNSASTSTHHHLLF
ncbi:uncharacterized protein DS421_13g422260 [Arachis hypogaea]|uniref:Floricaula/leafy-like transcription factor n=1 Tax=Arachis hypogaea TaxID=3818 RepID=A0A444ZY96_ARAHY|nr:uncharacterized protein DS421_13g422260 [Arachis hypogaea]RYR19157.1 hypothetical protein Ahy_B03g063867 [Arachis hypogaea]